jgi:hypothetical protein
VIKQTLAYDTVAETDPEACDEPEELIEPDEPEERTALYPFPGHYERRGVVADLGTPYDEHYEPITTGTARTESQYIVGGARIVWNS